jgi:hypothetical protein
MNDEDDNAQDFPLITHCCIPLQPSLAYVNQLKAPDAS